jgi:uncharacterized small protein (DUF1192 family)
MWEEDEPVPPRRVPLIPLDTLGVDELRGYIAELQTEIARAELTIARKQEHRGVAEKFFRS